MSATAAKPDCSRCRHFFVTWETANPRACRAYGFRSASWPSGVVLRESGSPCTLFEARAASEERVRKDARSSRDNKRR